MVELEGKNRQEQRQFYQHRVEVPVTIRSQVLIVRILPQQRHFGFGLHLLHTGLNLPQQVAHTSYLLIASKLNLFLALSCGATIRATSYFVAMLII